MLRYKSCQMQKWPLWGNSELCDNVITDEGFKASIFNSVGGRTYSAASCLNFLEIGWERKIWGPSDQKWGQNVITYYIFTECQNLIYWNIIVKHNYRSCLYGEIFINPSRKKKVYRPPTYTYIHTHILFYI